MISDAVRATRALIDHDALRCNLGTIRAAVGPGVLICAAVKANGYGHGAVEVARTLRRAGADALGVSNPFEGAELRESGERGPIYLFGQSVPEEAPLSVELNLIPFVGDMPYIQALEKACDQRNASLNVHLKVDTGMGRVGCRPEEAVGLATYLDRSPFLQMAGLATHYPSADSPESEDKAFTEEQTRRLESTAMAIRSQGIDIGILHAANTGGVATSASCHMKMVRPGIGLYGYGPAPSGSKGFKPVMTLRSRITTVKPIKAGETVSYGRTWKAQKDTFVGIVPVGYADGYPRILSNRADVLIEGKRYPVVGRVCMDQLMVNLGTEPIVGPADEVQLFSAHQLGPDALELADLAETIPYEITCGISARVPRVHLYQT